MDKNIAVVGCGYWGKNLVRVFARLGALYTICDTSPEVLSRLDALQAAILRVKLRHLEKWNKLRRSKASLYTKLLSQVDGVEPPYVEGNSKASCNYYIIRLVDSRLDRNELRKHLESKGIQTMVYYPLSLHLQQVYKNLGCKPGDFPRSERTQEEVLSLPMYPELSEAQIEEVVDEIKEFVGGSVSG